MEEPRAGFIIGAFPPIIFALHTRTVSGEDLGDLTCLGDLLSRQSSPSDSPASVHRTGSSPSHMGSEGAYETPPVL